MPAVRVCITLPECIYSQLKKEVPSGERSHFIAIAIRRLIKERQEKRLAMEYREAVKKMEERDVLFTLR